MQKRFCYSCMELYEDEGKKCPKCAFSLLEYKHDRRILPPGAIVGNRYRTGLKQYEDGFEIIYTGLDILTGNKVFLHEYFPAEISKRNAELSFSVKPLENEKYEAGIAFYLKRAERLFHLQKMEGTENITSYFPFHDTVYMIGEYLDGVLLHRLLNRRINEKEALAVGRFVIQAIEKLHTTKNLQGDISPENILVGKNRILLFAGGMERYEFANKISSKEIMPYDGFAAAELYEKSKISASIKSDVYAISALIYYLLTEIELPAATNYKKVEALKNLEKIIRKKNIEKSILAAVDEGMGLKKMERSSDLKKFSAIESYNVLPDINEPLEDAYVSERTDVKKKEIETRDSESEFINQNKRINTKKICIIVVIVFLLLFCTIQLIQGRKNSKREKIPEQKPEVTIVPEVTPTEEPPVPTLSEEPTTAPTIKPTARPTKKPKKKTKKKQVSTPVPTRKPTPTPYRSKSTSRQKSEVIEPNREESIKGIK